jgi:hypothetical protein
MAQEQHLRDGKPAGVRDGLEGGTTGSTSMTGGDRNDPSYGQSSSQSGASPAGQVSPAGDDMRPLDPGSVGGSPVGEAGGGDETGPGGQGSLASGTYNERGNVTGPDRARQAHRRDRARATTSPTGLAAATMRARASAVPGPPAET